VQSNPILVGDHFVPYRPKTALRISLQCLAPHCTFRVISVVFCLEDISKFCIDLMFFLFMQVLVFRFLILLKILCFVQWDACSRPNKKR
jgi:hypothetical protein